MVTLAIFIVLLILVMAGIPIAACMGLTAVICILALEDISTLQMLPARMYSLTTSFPLLAVPFFILAGNIMNTGGMTQRIFRFAQCIVGHLAGGLGHVSVVCGMIVAGMSGSAVADAAGIGIVAMEAMTKAGFDRRFSAAVTSAAATIGPVIPPSIPFVLYGCMTGTSIGRLFLGGVFPGIIMGVLMMVAVYLISKRRNYPKEPRASWKVIFHNTWSALPAIFSPILIIGSVLSGIATPTEAAVITCLYGLALTVGFYRELGVRDLRRIFWDTVRQSATVLFIMATANVFGWLLISQRVTDSVINGLISLSGTPWVILLIINIILLVLGCFIESISIMIMTIPVFMPIIERVGIDPVHFGVVLTLNMMIALLTPPVGLVLYTVSSISNVSMWKLAAELKWFFVALIVALAVVTYIPAVVLWFPNLLMG